MPKDNEKDKLPFDSVVAVPDYQERLSEWTDTINSFIYLIRHMECWYHFCLFGFFFVPATGKYAEVTIYQKDRPKFIYRCVSYSRTDPKNFTIHETELEMHELIEQLLWIHDPADFFPAYLPVRWDIVQQEEVTDSMDMDKIDEIYRQSKDM